MRRAPFVQFRSPVAWTTLELTLHADGRVEGRLTGASPFPRHWVYDAAGALSAKSGITDWKGWAGTAFGKHTPWGDEDSPAFVTEVETALERELSGLLMRGAKKPKVRKLRAGEVLTRQGDVGDQLFLLLDGVLVVDVDGKRVGRGRPRRRARRAGRDRTGPAHVDADRPDGLQGGRRAGRPDRHERLAALAAEHRRELAGAEA